MRFKGLDLNLLAALRALLEERNVSAAGRRLFVSQPAMSGALARLREHFCDPLLVMSGRQLVLTPFARSLLDPLRETMGHVEALVGATVQFDAATSHRRFVIVTSDYLMGVVIPHAAACIANEAPSITLEFSLPGAELPARFSAGEVDLVVTPEGFGPTPHLSELFFEEDHVVVGWADSDALASPLTVASLDALDHVVVRFAAGNERSFAEREMKRAGYSTRVACVAPSFLLVPSLLTNTRRVAVMHRRLAKLAARSMPLILSELPVALPPMRERMFYHPMHANDAGLSWLREHLRAALTKADEDLAYGAAACPVGAMARRASDREGT